MKKQFPESLHDDFFDYFIPTDQHVPWGIHCTSFGRVHTPPRGPYPSSAHPQNHFLSWEKGRVLREYQLLYISQGGGRFESELSSPVELKEGSLFLLFPGVWHRYRPDPVQGWTEFWLELGGAQIEQLHRSNILDPRRPVHQVGALPDILAAFTMAGQLAQTKAPGFQVRLAQLGLQILTHMAWPPPLPGSPVQHLQQTVQAALNLLASNLDKDLSPEWVARELHIGYSYFRRIFKAQTGFSPKQYRLEIRFRRTCDFLRNTDLTVKEISGQLHYDSPYHLSVDFKNRAGLPPQRWRRQASVSGISTGDWMRANPGVSSRSMKTSQPKSPWKKPAPKKAKHTKLTATDKAKAKRSAKKAGRPYPNLVDNMKVAAKKNKTKKK